MAWNNVFLKNKFILYGLGISNQSVKKFFDKNDISYIIVEDDFQLNEKYIVIKSPGISNETPFLKKCIKNNLLIISDIELFYLLRKDLKYIGITGSCGKTTTCKVLYDIIKDEYEVKLCGNIGIPIFDFIDCKLDYLIVELSSYQLEYIKEFKPNYFIILNVFKHHLNHHHTFNNYLNSKLKPINNMDQNDTLIINFDLIPFLNYQHINAKLFTFSKFNQSDCYLKNKQIIFNGNKLDIEKIKYFNYEFNVENFLSLFILLNILNINQTDMIKKLLTFNSLEHRMEEFIKKDDLVVINDSKSTSFNALKEGIKYCCSKYNTFKLVIIIGGKLDLEEIRGNITSILELNKYEVYCYGENRKILHKLINCHMYKDLEEVISNLKLEQEMVILFSPAAQSFDQFTSFSSRGEQFKKLIINKLKN